MKRLSPGRRILTSVAALMAVGGFFADWNRTYLFNSNWPRSLGSPIEKEQRGRGHPPGAGRRRETDPGSA
jgi:hypothetical protein